MTTRAQTQGGTQMSVRSTSIVAFMIMILLATATAAAPAWVKYTHPQLGFSLNYPENWTTAEMSGVDFMTLGPDAVGLPGMRLNVNVTHETVPAGTSADVYHTKTEEVLKSIFHEYRLLRTDRVKAVTYPALLRQYTWKANNGMELYQLQLVTVDGTRGFIVTGTTGAASAKLEDETKLLARILVTFQPR